MGQQEMLPCLAGPGAAVLRISQLWLKMSLSAPEYQPDKGQAIGYQSAFFIDNFGEDLKMLPYKMQTECSAVYMTVSY